MGLQELNRQELNELLGGETELAVGSDKNTNAVATCMCCIINSSSVVNTNNAIGCKCTCGCSTD